MVHSAQGRLKEHFNILGNILITLWWGEEKIYTTQVYTLLGRHEQSDAIKYKCSTCKM